LDDEEVARRAQTEEELNAAKAAQEALESRFNEDDNVDRERAKENRPHLASSVVPATDIQPISPGSDAALFPMMRAFDPNAGQLVLKAPNRMPSIDVSGFYDSIERVEWLSTSLRDEEGFETVETWLARQTGVSHLNATTWKEACDFFQFDPANLDPRSTVYFKGWNSAKALKAYQFFTVTHVLKKLASGNDVMIMALAMGLGKTAMGLAVLYLLSRFQGIYKAPTDGTFIVPERGPQLDLERLVGRQPKLRMGLTLILVPQKTMSQWAKERQAFIRTKFPIIVLAYQRQSAPGMEDGYPGCMGIWDKVPVQLWAPEVTTGNYWTAAQLAAYREADGIPMLDYLRSNVDGSPREWHHKWWVLSTVDSAETYIETTRGRQWLLVGGQQLKGCWSVVLIDEFHKTKNPTVRPWTTISTLHGSPYVIGLSATPFNKTKDIAAITMAPYLHYFKHKKGDTVQLVSPAEFAIQLDLRDDLSPRERLRVRSQSFLKMNECTGTVDSFVSKSTLKDSTGKVDTVAELIDQQAELNPKQQAAMTKFRGFLATQTIQFGAEFIWRPDDSKAGQPAIDIPPHSAFDIFIDIEHDSLSPLAEYYKRCLIWLNNANWAVLMGRMRTWLLFPSLYALQEDDEDLKAELGDLNAPRAKALWRSGDASTLWGYMEHIHNSKAMTLVREMITRLRNQKNVFKQGKKIVITAFKPMNAVIFHMYITWLADREDYTVVSSHEDFVFLDTWASAAANRSRMEAFVTTNPSEYEYSDKPFLMIAIASVIGVGVNLPPAEVIICLDGDYLPARDIQLSGRVQRNTAVQKAPHTESYRIICRSTFCGLNERQCLRNVTQAAIQKWFIEEKDAAAAKDAGERQEPYEVDLMDIDKDV